MGVVASGFCSSGSGVAAGMCATERSVVLATNCSGMHATGPAAGGRFAVGRIAISRGAIPDVDVTVPLSIIRAAPGRKIQPGTQSATPAAPRQGQQEQQDDQQLRVAASRRRP